ncbi:MAG: Gx transporter family protein [Lachnospiraceae bacterium]|nr:Gx transporter family protein [Lachnospiraceae bacterium]
MQSPSRKITTAAAFVAVGLIMGYIESFIVLPVGIPGFRIGIANIAVVLAMYLLGPVYGGCILLIRVILAAMLFGSGASFLYSLWGGVFSYAAMVVLSRHGFSVYGVSVAGAVVHNIAQTLVAYVLIGSVYVMTYVPALMIIGVFAGLLVGFISNIIYKRLRRILNFNEEGI